MSPTRSIWMDAGLPAFGPLRENVTADVCIVGGGIAGITTAWRLAERGLDVVLLDDGPIGGGETGRTTAHLSNALDDRFRRLERIHGEDGARLAAESHSRAIDLIEELVDMHGIDCAFERVDGLLFPPDENVDASDLAKELAAARRAGLAVDLVEASFSPFRSRTALRFPDQARFHPLRFLAGVAAAAQAVNARLHTGTRAESVEGGDEVRVTTASGHAVLARACIVATNSPINDRVLTHLKQAAYRTFAIAARVPRGVVPDALYWDDADPYTYVRLHPGEAHDWLIVGGQDHKTGQETDDERRLDALEAWTRDRFPAVTSVDHHWSGQVMEPADGLAFIGPSPDGAENVYIVTGDSGHGMTHGVIAAMLLPDLIAGQEHAWAQLYDPRRFRVRSAVGMARENLDVARRYVARVLPGEVEEIGEIASGEGRVLRRGGQRIAAYRDEQGRIHERSAICTHLGCVVHWNALEHSWDCPCHGSRFMPDGAVLNGPAAAPLEGVGDD